MAADAELTALAARLGAALLAAGARLVTAESCTGGWLAKCLTDVPGSSNWFECGFVTYSNAAKIRDLGVSPRTLAGQGAVSEAAAREMAQGALERAAAEVSIAITGIAGPDGGTAAKPVGTVWFAVAQGGGSGVYTEQTRREFRGDRAAIRRASVECGLELLLALDLTRRRLT